MGAENAYLKNNIPALYRKSIMDVAIYVFIDTQKFTIPSISIEESAKAFIAHNNINEEEYSLDAILKSYLRTRKQIIEDEKTDSKKDNQTKG